MKIQINKADNIDAELISQLAQNIWPQTYANVISPDQIKLMLQNIYTPAAILQAMKDGQRFFLLQENDVHVGFIALKRKDNQTLRVEKLYLLPEVQGKGYGMLLIDFASSNAQEMGMNNLELNVNRKNKAVQFYINQGFEIIQEVDIPYHEYILDDYIMQKKLLS